jgi:PST family polysaccharide transporter
VTAGTAVPTAEGLGGRAARGAFMSLVGQGLRVALQLLSIVILSRLLGPGDYGLLAMVLAVIGVADVFRDLGLSTAAIQARTLCGLAFVAAPLLAEFYGRAELVDMTRALSLTFVLSGLATQYRVGLTRELRFGRLAAIDVAAPLLGLAAAVPLALGGAGYWALVAQQLAQYAALAVLVIAAGRWLPGRFDGRVPMDGMLRFGWNMVGSQLLGYGAANIDSLVIGTRFGADALGLYNRAFQLVMTPLGQLRGPSTQVALPVLSSLHDDHDRHASFLRRGQLALGYTLVVGLALVVGAAEPVTAVFLGDRWQEVPPLLRLLALAGMFQTLAFVGYWVYLSRALTGALVRFSLFDTAVRAVLILVGMHWGVVGVAAGYALAPALTWPVSLWWLSRLAPLPARHLTAGALRILGVSAVVAGAAWLTSGALDAAPPWLALIAACAAGATVYAAIGAAVTPVRRDLQQLLHVGRLALRRGRISG